MDAPFESSVAHVQCCISDRCLMFKSMDVNKYIGGETLIFHFAEMLTIEPGFISCGLNILQEEKLPRNLLKLEVIYFCGYVAGVFKFLTCTKCEIEVHQLNILIMGLPQLPQ